MIEERLLTDVTGRVIRPDDDDYDAARQVVLGGIDRRPSAIVRVADASDVARVIRFARDTGTELAVRSGGHSGAGHSTTEGGMVIDLRDLRALEVDPDRADRDRPDRADRRTTLPSRPRSTAWPSASVIPGRSASAASRSGEASATCRRRDGLTIDNLIAAEIVTADGEVREVDADDHPDLFWAIRGGGGNFGVATRFTYRLSELGRMVGGMLFLPATPETVAGYMAAAADAPDALSTIANVMSCPPMPFIPEEHHDRPVIMGILAWSGDVAEGERRMAPFRDLAPALADQVTEIGYPDLFPPEEAEADYHPLAESVTMFTREIGEAQGPEHHRGYRGLGCTDAGRAAPPDGRRHRAGRAGCHGLRASVEVGHGQRRLVLRRTRRSARGDGPGSTGLVTELDQGETGAYVNFVNDEGPERVRDAYPGATWDRLAAIKAKYDPTNLFRLNQNVPPAA